MKWNKLYKYPKSTRSLINNARHYSIEQDGHNGFKLPSVTTILSATQPAEKRESLANWRKREGAEKAQRIMDQAAARGTAMHKILEGYVEGKNVVDMTPVGEQATPMAKKIIEDGLNNRLDEIWGSEVTVHYPGLYAGATDLVGIYEKKPSIMDFKQSNKPKRVEWISDYFMQLGAYAMAHNFVYGTKIEQGVILMCTPDNYFQKFVVNGQQFVAFQHQFLARVDEYYKIQKIEEGNYLP
jgi:genome maintenance exonuclease 1